MADTLCGPGGDAAVVRVHGTKKALALTADCTPRYVAADANQGAKQAVAEAWRNLTATGARPLAITDCLNFGNPEKPEIMGQFAEAVGGMGEACRALDFPVVSGNVSLYNETQGQAIPPTPVIGGVGLIDDAAKAVNVAFKAEGEAIVVIGVTAGHLGQSLYLREIEGRQVGAPPPVDLGAEKRHGDLVRQFIMDGLVTACHDVSDGGLVVALAEMALASGMGAEVAAPRRRPPARLAVRRGPGALPPHHRRPRPRPCRRYPRRRPGGGDRHHRRRGPGHRRRRRRPPRRPRRGPRVVAAPLHGGGVRRPPGNASVLGKFFT